MPKLGAATRFAQRWHVDADAGGPPAGGGQGLARPFVEPPRLAVRGVSMEEQSAPTSADSAGGDPMGSGVRALFKSTYDQLPLNAHYTVVDEVPGNYALLYKHGFHLLQVTCKVFELEHITLPLNPADATRVLESRSALEQMLVTIRERSHAYYAFSLEGVHLMRLAKDPLYTFRPNGDAGQAGSPAAAAPGSGAGER